MHGGYFFDAKNIVLMPSHAGASLFNFGSAIDSLIGHQALASGVVGGCEVRVLRVALGWWFKRTK